MPAVQRNAHARKSRRQILSVIPCGANGRRGGEEERPLYAMRAAAPALGGTPHTHTHQCDARLLPPTTHAPQ